MIEICHPKELKRVIIFDKNKMSQIKYHERKKSGLFRRAKPAGYYGNYGDFYGATLSDVLKGFGTEDTKFIENDCLYIKPHVCLHFKKGHHITKYFDTYEEAKEWGQGVASASLSKTLSIEYQN